MARMAEYCQHWRLKPSVAKTVSSVFHLHNASASHQLNVTLNGQRLKHDPLPVYLGVTLDRTLTYKEHLEKTAGKLKTRNNLLMKLAGSSWGAHANTLRTSAFALCYSVGEYSLGSINTHEDGRRTAEHHHATDQRDPPTYPPPMACRPLQH